MNALGLAGHPADFCTLTPCRLNLRLYASGQPRPLVSTLNDSAGQTRANKAVAGLSASGSLSVYCSQGAGSAHYVVDVNGYFK